MKDFRNLNVWRKAHELALAVYRETRKLPKEEMFGLTSQIRRSVMSIPANIAEGCGRSQSSGDFARFLQIAAGSASETEYHLLLARDLGFFPGELHSLLDGAVVEVKRMLSSLIQTVRKPQRRDETER